MEEIIEWYEIGGMPIPLDIQVKAIETYGFIIDNNYPLEDVIHEEEAE